MKTKNIYFFFLGICALFLSCSQSEPTTEGESLISVMVQDFQVSTDAFVKGACNEEASTRASLADAFQYLTIAVFNAEGVKIGEVNQTKTDADYGVVQFSLSFGHYTLVAVGYASRSGTFCRLNSLEEVDFVAASVPDAFSASQQININSTDPQTLLLNLERRVAQFTFTTTDVVPANFSNATMKMVVKGVGRLLNPVTGMATKTDSVYVIGTATIGNSLKTSVLCFLPEDSCGVEVRVDILQASGDSLQTQPKTLLSRTFKDVPLQRNHKTEASGQFFLHSTLQFSASAEWGATHTYSY